MNRRPMLDSVVSTIIFIVQQGLAIDTTGKSWKMIEDEARHHLYARVDTAAGGPPIDNEAKYTQLVGRVRYLQHLVATGQDYDAGEELRKLLKDL